MKSLAQVYQLNQNPLSTSSFKIPEIIGKSPAMQEVFRIINRLARFSVTVLLNGESGTGKELVARALHGHGPRAHKPFIALNMAAMPRGLLESELFGHERGAFTGAHTRRIGRFEQADGGTLFLDEIGDMPIEMQTRLLRVLAEGEFYPIGAQSPVRVDVRIITATHQNLEALVSEGLFREDLYHRLNVIRLNLPSLRERREDIPLLLRHYLQEASVLLNEKIKFLLPETEQYLCSLNWPGNVRQLENVCNWITVMVPGREVHLHDLPVELLEAEKLRKEADWQEAVHQWVENRLESGASDVAKEFFMSAEKVLIVSALRQSHGQRYVAAQRLGYSRNTLTRKMRELDL
jgi:two-component system nitrogen regulation response regulator GlnG